MRQLTRQEHSLLDGHGVLPRPLLDLLVHLVDLGGVHRPETTLPLVRPGHDGLLDLLEALVQAQVVADRVLPARGRRLEVGEVLAEINKINLLRNYIFMRQNKVPKMGGGKLPQRPSKVLMIVLHPS